MDHLEHMDRIREGIGFQGYAQQDPLIAYKKEAFGVFQSLLSNINRSIVAAIFKVNTTPQDVPRPSVADASNVNYSGGKEPGGFNILNAEQINNIAGGQGGVNRGQGGQQMNTNSNNGQAEASKPIINKDKEIGRNDKCPCGSEKKYKKCCGR